MLPISFRRWPLAVVIVLALGLLLAGTAMAQGNPRYAGIVIDADTHDVLYAENADERRYPASLTKMMTLYLLFEALEDRRFSLNQTFGVSRTAAAMPATKLWLKPGDSLRVETAIEALVVRSANDVAVVVAEALGGTESRFAQLMTDKARALGMHSTTFRNASGLPDDRQVTTARDMAMLSRRLMLDFPQYYHYFSRQSFTWRGKTVRGHNRLLASYPGADGLKTGFIRASGFNVATSAVRGDRRILSVVMGGYTSASRDKHMTNLLDRGFLRASLSDGRGWLASTRITQERLAVPGSAPMSAPMIPARQVLAANSPQQYAPAAIDRRVEPSSAEVVSQPRRSASPTRVAQDIMPASVAASRYSTSAPAQTEVANVRAFASAPEVEELKLWDDSRTRAASVVEEVTSAPREMLATLEPAAPTPAPGPVLGSSASPVAPAVARVSAPVNTPVTASQAPSAGGEWGVQVGAFSSADSARSLAAQAAEIAEAQVAVPQVAGGSVYRARLMDMGEGQARNACQRLQASGIDCMVVQASL
jgi:D-alanyl-D-alanine carboxypeptidase